MRRRGSGGLLRVTTTRVTRINVADRMRRAVNLVNGCNALAEARTDELFNRVRAVRASAERKSLTLISFRKSSLAIILYRLIQIGRKNTTKTETTMRCNFQ